MDFGGIDWNAVQASGGDFKRPTAGGYVVRITGVENQPERDKLVVTYDIAEGEFAGQYSDEWGQSHPWAHQFYVSYKPNALGLFKQFFTILEEANGFKWDGHSESMFIGKVLGIVLKEEEYRANDGSIKTSFSKLVTYKTPEQIRNKEFKVPELKKLPESERGNAFEAVSKAFNEPVPFI